MVNVVLGGIIEVYDGDFPLVSRLRRNAKKIPSVLYYQPNLVNSAMIKNDIVATRLFDETNFCVVKQ